MRYRILLLALTASGTAAPLVAQTAELSGTLTVVWADPRRPGERPFEIASLQGADGTVTHVSIPPALARQHGGAMNLGGRRVRLAVRRTAALRGTSVRSPLLVEAVHDVQPLPANVTTGSRPYVTILCKFADWPGLEPASRDQVERAMNGTYPGTAHYWTEVSNGQFDITGSRVVGWYTLPHAQSHYVGPFDANLTAITNDCAAAADDDVNFAEFAGINFLLNSDLGCCSYGGVGAISRDGVSRAYPMTWLSGDAAHQTGVIHHEMGHSLGLMHSSGPYGLVYDSRWDVMSTAAWHLVPGTGFLVGAHVNAYGKHRLGWIPESRVLTMRPGTRTVLLESHASPENNSNYLMVKIPAPSLAGWEYFTLEARGLSGYDTPLAGQGVVIHRIGGGGASPSNVVDADGNMDPSDRGAVIEPGEWYEDRANGIRVAVLERVGNAFRVEVRLNDYPHVLVQPAQREMTITAGAGTPIVDSVLVTVSGTGSEATPWAVAALTPGPVIAQSVTGSGTAYLRYALDPRITGAGTYYQTYRIIAGSSTAQLDFKVTVQPAEVLTAGVSQAILRDSVVVGRASGATLQLRTSGAGSDTAQWVLTSQDPWITVTTPSGTGRGVIAFTRNTEGLAAGVHVGRLTLTVPGAAGSPIEIVDSLRVLGAPEVRVVARGGTSAAVPRGGRSSLDSVRVELTGSWATSGTWYAGQYQGSGYLSSTQSARTGNGWFYFRRSAGELAPGTYPSTIRITLVAAMDIIAEVADTLFVSDAPARLTVDRNSLSDTVVSVYVPSRDSVWVQPEGPGSGTMEWRATTVSRRIYFLGRAGAIPGQGRGPGWVHFVRRLDGLAAGVHVDTVYVVPANGTTPSGAARWIDTLVVIAGPAIATEPRSRRHDVLAGSVEPVADSARVELTGWNASAVRWTAAAARPWTTLATASGTGSGMLRWTRNPATLAVGVHVDTIAVWSIASGAPLRIVDTLRIYPALTIASAVDRPDALMGAEYADTLESAGGPGGEERWDVAAGLLPSGLELAPAGRITGVPRAAGSFTYTARVTVGAVSAERELTLVVRKPVLATEAVVDQLLGNGALSNAERRFLDLLGNDNGRVDVGDVRAWLAEMTGQSITEADVLRLLRVRDGGNDR